MISVCGESPTVREVFYCGDAFATVVSVNRTGGTVAIPFTLDPETPAEKQRCAGASSRRQERLEVHSLPHQQQQYLFMYSTARKLMCRWNTAYATCKA